MKTVRFSHRYVPVLLVVVTAAAYSLLLPMLGFYWDDWAFAFLAHFYGPAELVRAFSAYRPFLGPIFFLTTSVLGSSPLAWQIFGLFIRLGLGLTLWWMLNCLWPKNPRQNLTVTLIFLVFPGYSQQWVALTHTNQELIPLIAYLASFGFSIRAARGGIHSRRDTVLGVLLGILGLFSTEYFIGYEFIRFIILLLVVEGKKPFERLINTLKAWLPYLILWMLDAIWLVIYYRSGAYQSYSIKALDGLANGLGAYLGSLVVEGVNTLTTAGLLAWLQAPNLASVPATGTVFAGALALLVISFLALGYFRTHLEDGEEAQPDSDRWAWQAVLIGLAAVILGRVPSWVAGLPFVVLFDYDRFFISIMLGASILLVGVIEWIIKPGNRRIWISSLLVAFAICAQFLYANIYRRDWDNQKAFFNQLAWRAPGIQPGTLLITDAIAGIPHTSDMGISAGVNWIYHPDQKGHDLPVMVTYSDIRLGKEQLPALAPNQPVHIPFRTASFSGSTSQSILFYVPENGCLRLVDSKDTVAAANPALPEDLAAAVPLSNTGLIDTTASSPALPEYLFGKAAAKDWCYFYEKAELARQQGDWAAIVKLGEEATKADLGPRDSLELMPFVEGYVHEGKLAKAKPMMDQLSPKQTKATNAVCLLLKRMASENTDPETISYITKNQSQRNCPK